MTGTSTTIVVALNKLDQDPRNVRQTYEDAEILEMAASIKARNFRLIQNLAVRPGEKKGRFYVTAGGLRRAAFLYLAEHGEIAKTHPIECGLWDGADATEISLAENVIRRGMNPADELAAFLVLRDEGKSPVEIAARFGRTEIAVNRTLALAKVAPELLDLYRKGEMSLEELKAFTVSDDHARQIEVWESLPSYNRQPYYIKNLLTKGKVSGNDKRVTFIGGLDAFEAAGGAVRRTLFSDHDGGGYATDSGLLDQLVLQKLEQVADGVRAEGWAWVEVHSERPTEIYSMGRVYPETPERSAEDQARLDQLSEEYDSLAELIEAGAADDDAETKLAAISEQIDATEFAGEAYKPDDLARAGAIVYLDPYGNLDIARGLLRDDAEDDSDEAGESVTANDEAEGEDAAPEPIVIKHSQSLIEDLTAQKTAALRVELADNPDIALATVVHVLLLQTVYRGERERSALQITLTHEDHESLIKSPADCKAAAAFASLKENFESHIPGNPADLWDWCLRQDRDHLLTLLAFAAAHSLNAMETKFHGRSKGLAHANEIGKALDVDVRKWFETTDESYFTHLTRPSIQAAVTEARGAERAIGIAAMTKAKAVEVAHKAVKGSGWLPEPLRIAPQAGNDDQADAAPFPVAAE
ncbi:ParB/RepB/Spo0J family partition protein [Pannonibacter phragmitetus]|uniref:ParB/RepB/Spo0J family partition protein n=1 Tax=Pannonibacter phragmitetus TaxID=121719 RepID=UPI000F036007|nr:ParB/RepB/Spo0J family partition protein [Pannonibacter phragmitetus]